MLVWTRIALVSQLGYLAIAQNDENSSLLPSMEDFIAEVENNENLLNDVNIANITAMITETIANSDSNVEDIMNSAIENIMNNIAESNNAGTTQVPTESTGILVILEKKPILLFLTVFDFYLLFLA